MSKNVESKTGKRCPNKLSYLPPPPDVRKCAPCLESEITPPECQPITSTEEKPATINTNYDNQTATLHMEVNGYLGFKSRAVFTQAYEKTPRIKNLIIDMKSCPDMASCALGMLLIMREVVLLPKAKMQLTHCNEQLKLILYTTEFERYFEIS